MQCCAFLKYIQTWANDHLWIATTCLQQPLFRGLVFHVYRIELPLNNEHLAITAQILGSRRSSLNTDLTVIMLGASYSDNTSHCRSHTCKMGSSSKSLNWIHFNGHNIWQKAFKSQSYQTFIFTVFGFLLVSLSVCYIWKKTHHQ